MSEWKSEQVWIVMLLADTFDSDRMEAALRRAATYPRSRPVETQP